MSAALALTLGEEDSGEGAFDQGALDTMAWTVPEYTIQEVNAAGRNLTTKLPDGPFATWSEEDLDTLKKTLSVISNWRAAHAYPLNTFQINLRNSARRLCDNPVVGQRVKRMISITRKLWRQPKMKLSQMQDIGGCRAVLENVDQVRQLVNYYHKVTAMKHKLASFDNYIDRPKPTGYRGVHLVYRYYSDRNVGKSFNGLKIEMQIRSQFQHAWATTVETVGTFVGQALKSNIGDEEWKRFFALMGSAIAMRENSPYVPGTPTGSRELATELHGYAIELNVENKLRAYGHALKTLTSRAEEAHYFLLELDPEENELKITGFKMNEMNEAEAKYQEAELIARDNPGKDAVLVSVDSLMALERAYPNYFADTRIFAELLSQELSGHMRGIQVPPLVLETG